MMICSMTEILISNVHDNRANQWKFIKIVKEINAWWSESEVLGRYVGLNDKIEQETQNLDLNRVINIFSGSILACEKF